MNGVVPRSIADVIALHAAALRLVHDGEIPWVPSSTPGKSARPLCFLRDGFVELLRMEPGVAMPPHRHTGVTHVFQFEGWRRLDDGRLAGPGDYACEPAGHVDAWDVVGETALLALVIVGGEVEMLADDGSIRLRIDAASRRR
ncbi:MAG: hypothetical protein HOQ02_02110, partial [Lysobacter sp.]|nr:hypothetical protein [Lysobacter sp.]